MRKDGSLTAVAIALGHTDVSGGTAVAFVRDISDVRGLEARIRFQATHDTLTGLANRWQFGLELEQAIAVSERTGQSFALLLLDLDDFKAINDGYGHAAGERLLLEASRRLQSALRAGDTVARLGGDEFTVVLPAIAQPQDVEQVAAKLLGVLCQPYRMHGFDLAFSASLGIAVYPRDARDATTLLPQVIAPIIAGPKCSSAIAGTFGSMAATVSPRPIPRRSSAEASRRHRS